MGIDRMLALLICFPSIPPCSTFSRTFSPSSRVHSIPHHCPHFTTPLTQAHHHSYLILPPTLDIILQPLMSPLTSLYSTIIINDFIPSSSLHHYDTFMTSHSGLSFWTFMDTFRTHLLCLITFIVMIFTFFSSFSQLSHRCPHVSRSCRLYFRLILFLKTLISSYLITLT